KDALEIPSMVDLAEFRPADRPAVRAELGLDPGAVTFAWVGRLDRKKRVEDFLRAAAIAREMEPSARFVIVGGPAAFMPEDAREPILRRRLAAALRAKVEAAYATGVIVGRWEALFDEVIAERDERPLVRPPVPQPPAPEPVARR